MSPAGQPNKRLYQTAELRGQPIPEIMLFDGFGGDVDWSMS
jgi:hypothetical protein